MNGSVCALLLAGGRGTRFDPTGRRNKLAALLPDGRTVLRASAERLCEVVDRVTVVIPAATPELADLVGGLPVSVVHNSRAALGMGTSIACGVAHAPAATGWLVALGDMPFIAATSLIAVVRALDQGASIAAPVYRGERGHPVGFSSAHFAELAGLTGDSGARELLKRHPLVQVEVADSGILRDIDRPEDLA